MTAAREAVASQVLAANFMAQLAHCGVEHVFLAPGSRSQALAIAAQQLAQSGKLKLTVRVDERSLAFQALGVARATNRPVAIVTTSGTAVANLLPAVLEAFHTSTPLLLLTADRPHALRNTGSNQTTLQNGIFGEFVLKCFDIDSVNASHSAEVVAEFAKELAVDAVAVALGHARKNSGPVQVNLSFSEPLSSTLPVASGIDSLLPPTQIEPVVTEATVDVSLRTIVIAGDQANSSSDFDVTGLPIFAEPSSGLLSAPTAIHAYRKLLAGKLPVKIDMDAVQQIIVLGKPTLSREVQALVRRPGLKVYAIAGKHRNFKPTEQTIEVTNLNRTGVASQQWLDFLQSAVEPVISRLLAPDTPISTDLMTEWLPTFMTDAIVFGASTVIRDFDIAGTQTETKIFANRGLAGIDGTIAFATGIALAEPASKVRVFLGDLTAVHDAGSLAYLDSEPNLNLQVFVLNNGGGKIFERLEVRHNLDDQSFDELFTTPQQVNFEALAAAYRWKYLKVSTLEEYAKALEVQGRVLVELLVSP